MFNVQEQLIFMVSTSQKLQVHPYSWHVPHALQQSRCPICLYILYTHKSLYRALVHYAGIFVSLPLCYIHIHIKPAICPISMSPIKQWIVYYTSKTLTAKGALMYFPIVTSYQICLCQYPLLKVCLPKLWKKLWREMSAKTKT